MFSCVIHPALSFTVSHPLLTFAHSSVSPTLLCSSLCLILSSHLHGLLCTHNLHCLLHCAASYPHTHMACCMTLPATSFTASFTVPHPVLMLMWSTCSMLSSMTHHTLPCPHIHGACLQYVQQVTSDVSGCGKSVSQELVPTTSTRWILFGSFCRTYMFIGIFLSHLHVTEMGHVPWVTMGHVTLAQLSSTRRRVSSTRNVILY